MAMSEEGRRRISEAKKQWWAERTPEERRRITAASAEAKKGKPLSAEHRAKIGVQVRGRGADYKQKQSESLKQHFASLSPEEREQRFAHLRRPKTPEHVANATAAIRRHNLEHPRPKKPPKPPGPGRGPKTAEHRLKIREGHERWAARTADVRRVAAEAKYQERLDAKRKHNPPFSATGARRAVLGFEVKTCERCGILFGPPRNAKGTYDAEWLNVHYCSRSCRPKPGAHSLTEINPAQKTARCATCGPVTIARHSVRSNGEQAWRCSVLAGQRMAEWASSHQEQIKDIRKQHYTENREQILAAASAYRRAHREELNATKRAYWAANPDKALAMSQRKRARKRDAPINDFTLAEWLEVVAEFGNACAYCLRDDLPLTLDHVLALSRGGPHTRCNIVPACGPCNSSKLNLDLMVFFARLVARGVIASAA